MNVDCSTPVLVTGANGYVASWVVKRLLDVGATVHAAVRTPDDVAKTEHLQRMAQGAPGKLRLFRADLLDAGSYAAAMNGCGIVFHTASPFVTRVKDPQRELVDPALLGTRNVLEEAGRTKSVKRVVVTSSCAAIYSDAIDTVRAPGGKLTEAVWNTTASLDYQPYSYSKTVAEREAWRIAEAQSQWRLVVVNPSLVIGPALQKRPSSESFAIVRQLADGTMKQGAPRFPFGVVDVRDLADAHLAAAYRADAEGRHIVSAHDTDILELGGSLLEEFGDRYPLPRRALPKWLLWLVGPMVKGGLPRKIIARNVDVPWRADHGKSVRALGMQYRPLKESMVDMFRQMIDDGMLARR